MKMRPIIFDAESIRAILDDRKRQTRRVIKPQPQATCTYVRNGETFTGVILPKQPSKWCGGLYWRYGAEWGARPDTSQPFPRCPYGVVGDGLWARETWQHCPECGRIEWRADANEGGAFCRHCDGMLSPRWKPSIHMFREDSRIDLAVTGMRAQRLQDITAADCEAEGWPEHLELFPTVNREYKALAWFRHRWDAINAKRGYPWDGNWWVWVPEFERVTE